jgi:beta-glucosidase
MKQFPKDFIWGSATSSYQIEGAWNKGGKGLSIWDAFSHTPGKTYSGQTGDKACNHYELFREDVRLMAKIGLKAYRFSISWPRILPSGRGEINQSGIQFYSDLIDTLLEHGIQPWVTLYHWDLPLALQMELDGWLNPDIADHFANYADICFQHFGDRVKHWITLNEPWVVSILGYGQGVFAPGRISKSEPYVSAHQLLRAHAKAVQVYRKKYLQDQNGKIGITNNCDWREPLTDNPNDIAAAQRALEFFLGWFTDPIYLGDYPEVMRERVGERLPSFNESEKALLRDSSDFFGLNHYTTAFASDVPEGDDVDTDVYGNGGIFEDQYVKLTSDPEWKKTDMGWSIVPWGCRKLLNWIDERYQSPEIIITENGCASDDRVEEGNVLDPVRIEFIKDYLGACHEAIQGGVKLKGYFYWSLLDNFEWALGYSKRLGITHTDFSTLTRTLKKSGYWYADVIKRNGL